MNSALHKIIKIFVIALLLINCAKSETTEKKDPLFKVIAFYTGENDLGHISFVNEANKWFLKTADENNFKYESTNNWGNLNKDYLSKFEIVIFLDTRPEDPEQRKIFENYMENGGGWIGFHFSAFALTPSSYNQDWDWYHNIFLGSGEYKGNTWRPTSATLKVENKNHAVTKNLPELFKSQPNEWYNWVNDLRENKNIDILLSIDTSSFPLGTGPKTHEIWRDGYYPVVWTNKNYKMLYINMGHNDINYEQNNEELSFTFENVVQNKMLVEALLWIGNKK